MIKNFQDFVNENVSSGSISINYDTYLDRVRPLEYLNSKEYVINEELWDMSFGDWVHLGVDIGSMVSDFFVPGAGTVIDIVHGLAYFVEANITDKEKDKPMLYLSGLLTLMFAFPGFNPLQLGFKLITKPFSKIFAFVSGKAGAKGVTQAAEALSKSPKVAEFVGKLEPGFSGLKAFFAKESADIAQGAAKKPGWFSKFTGWLKKKFGKIMPDWLKNAPKWISDQFNVLIESLENLFKALKQSKLGKAVSKVASTKVGKILGNILKLGAKGIKKLSDIIAKFFIKGSPQFKARIGKKMISQLTEMAAKKGGKGYAKVGENILIGAGKKNATLIVKGTTKEGTKIFSRLTSKFTKMADDMMAEGTLKFVSPKTGKKLTGAALQKSKARWVKNMAKSNTIRHVPYDKISTGVVSSTSKLMSGFTSLKSKSLPVLFKWLLAGFWINNEVGSEDAPDEVGADQASGGEVLTEQQAIELEQSLAAENEAFPDDLWQKFNEDEQQELLGQVNQIDVNELTNLDEDEQDEEQFPKNINQCLWASFKDIGMIGDIPEKSYYLTPTDQLYRFQNQNGIKATGEITKASLEILKKDVSDPNLTSYLKSFLLTYEQQEEEQSSESDEQSGENKKSQDEKDPVAGKDYTPKKKKEKVQESHQFIIKKFSDFSY